MEQIEAVIIIRNFLIFIFAKREREREREGRGDLTTCLLYLLITFAESTIYSGLFGDMAIEGKLER